MVLSTYKFDKDGYTYDEHLFKQSIVISTLLNNKGLRMLLTSIRAAALASKITPLDDLGHQKL